MNGKEKISVKALRVVERIARNEVEKVRCGWPPNLLWNRSSTEKTEAERKLRFDKLKIALNKKIKYKKKPFRSVWCV